MNCNELGKNGIEGNVGVVNWGNVVWKGPAKEKKIWGLPGYDVWPLGGTVMVLWACWKMGVCGGPGEVMNELGCGDQCCPT